MRVGVNDVILFNGKRICGHSLNVLLDGKEITNLRAFMADTKQGIVRTFKLGAVIPSNPHAARSILVDAETGDPQIATLRGHVQIVDERGRLLPETAIVVQRGARDWKYGNSRQLRRHCHERRMQLRRADRRARRQTQAVP